tara:strand:- start:164 stop:475 length:312 start_codon:yes stop_codon:yes gene_type:complete
VESYRSVTEKESLRLIKGVLGDDELVKASYPSHRLYTEDVYRIAVNMLSLAAILKLLDASRVETVYWHPSAAPPGSHVSSIASRYILYVKYRKIKKRGRSVKK